MIGDISVKTNLYLVSGYTDMRRSIDGTNVWIAAYRAVSGGHAIGMR